MELIKNLVQSFINLGGDGGLLSRRLDQPPRYAVDLPYRPFKSHSTDVKRHLWQRKALNEWKIKPIIFFWQTRVVIWNTTKIRVFQLSTPAYTYSQTGFHAYSKTLHNRSYNTDYTVWFFCFSFGLVRVYESVRSHWSDCCDRRAPLPCSVHVCVQNIGE